MTRVIHLRGGEENGTRVCVEFHDGDGTRKRNWPICIRGVDRNRLYLTDEEAVHLMQVLQDHYPLEALANV